ncbi:MAG: TrkH family potassium uptake protein, partial [Candidatus Omnitrophica bacterium]|nr:TrkH family potassium uptake protein [Candidatus Omnitrophota bacterium]
MIIRPQYRDVKIISYYLGKIILGVGLCMLLPIAAAILFREWSPSLDFVIGMMGSFAAGFLLVRLFYTNETLDWMHGMIIASLSWVAAMLVSAVPLILSGHYLSFLDACFETMSGFTTSGLSLVQDLDHLSRAHNIWRHFMQFIGGQG